MARNGGKRRGHRRGFAYALLCFALATGLIIGCITIFFRINNFEVLGNQRYSTQEIVDTLPIEKEDNLLMIDKFAASRALFESLAYLKSVKISRLWPSTVVVEVEEAQPVAHCLDEAGRFWLLDDTGKLLEQVPDVTAKVYPLALGLLPLSPQAGQIIALKEEELDKLKAFTELYAGLSRAGLADKVTRLDIEQTFQLGFRYDDRFDVLIGLPADIDLKLQFFAAALESMSAYERGAFDLSQAPGKSIYFVPS